MVTRTIRPLLPACVTGVLLIALVLQVPVAVAQADEPLYRRRAELHGIGIELTIVPSIPMIRFRMIATSAIIPAMR